MSATQSAGSLQPTSNRVFRSILVYGGYLAGGIAVVGMIAGGLTAGGIGVLSALIGTGMSVVFMGITAGSILIANRFAGTSAAIGAFFGIVLGGWLLKFVVFLVLVVLLKGQPWVQPVVLFLSIIAGVIGSLVVDVVVIRRSRVPYVSDLTRGSGTGKR